jgi:hypothetical protein
MKTFANASALLVAISLMIGLLVAQNSYQNSWRGAAAIQTPANAVANNARLEGSGGYKVVMK